MNCSFVFESTVVVFVVVVVVVVVVVISHNSTFRTCAAAHQHNQRFESSNDGECCANASMPPDDDDDDDDYVVVFSSRSTAAAEPLSSPQDPQFPADPFTQQQQQQQKRHGLLVLRMFGVMYAFCALAIVCDEFFVPSLDAIVDDARITAHVAAAAFTVAGCSTPELLTSIVDAFATSDNVAIGAVVGSAGLNALSVVASCALLSPSAAALPLTRWPLLRDCTFYAVTLLALITFLRDKVIELREAVALFSVYVAYVACVKWNRAVARFAKTTLLANGVTRVGSCDQLMPKIIQSNCNVASVSQNSGTSAQFQSGLLQLMMQTLDPMHEDKVDTKAVELHALASLKALLDATKTNQGAATATAARNLHSSSFLSTSKVNNQAHSENFVSSKSIVMVTEEENDDEIEKPLDHSWPNSTKKRLFYLFTLPIVLPLWLTLPNPRSKRGRKFFVVTFIGSLCWIAIYSYLMVWCVTIISKSLSVSSEVMALTFLAAGTSVPDLITSVIMTKKGCADMAVSLSIGSNIFDVTIGLPFPWILYNVIIGRPVKVNSTGMTCSIATLLLMLILLVISIACFGWKINNRLGYTLIVLHILFVILSLFFEYQIIQCPL